MSSFTPIRNTLHTLEQYAKMGDIEAIKLVDFSVFKKSEIRDISSKLHKYNASSNHDYGVGFEAIQACIDYINEQKNEVFTWETSQLIIYSQCYYDNSGECLHKVQFKDTQNMSLVYCSELAIHAKNEGKFIEHFIN